jgi:predicted Zn-dependent peptidase
VKFYETTLDNGLTVIAELNPHVQSVAAGFFVRTGARDEAMEVNGVSHFLEHMAFKGNEKHSADDVNRIFDELGARYNASTSEEVTLYYAAVLPEYLPDAFEVLAGLMRPSLRGSDFEVERKVILEEIGMYEDQPSFIAYENAMKTHFDRASSVPARASPTSRATRCPTITESTTARGTSRSPSPAIRTGTKSCAWPLSGVGTGRPAGRPG